MKVLFVCSANKLSSPTAGTLFKTMNGIDALSAGTDQNSTRPLTKELVVWAYVIVAMESHHRERIRRKFKQRPADNWIIMLNIPDEYERDDPAPIALLKEKAWSRLELIRDHL